MKRIFFSLMFISFSAPAFAASWAADKEGNYSLVAKGQALTLECHAAKSGETTVYTPELYYWPSCSIGCKDTSLDDATKKATVLAGDKSFSVTVGAGDTQALPLKPDNGAQEIFEAIARVNFISVYSSQISPKYSAFENISNPETLANFYADCASGKANQAATAARLP